MLEDYAMLCYVVYLFAGDFELYSTLLQHDELKPLTKSFTDSLSELGNLKVILYWLRAALISRRESNNLFT